MKEDEFTGLDFSGDNNPEKFLEKEDSVFERIKKSLRVTDITAFMILKDVIKNDERTALINDLLNSDDGEMLALGKEMINEILREHYGNNRS